VKTSHLKSDVKERLAVSMLALLSVAGCTTGVEIEPSSLPSTPAPSSPEASAPPSSPPVEFNPALHDEMIAMLERDQAGRLGGTDAEGDVARTERLKEIIDEFGWPTFDLVGDDGEDAAWAIAQHSDLDPAFQAHALELLRDAVTAGQASPGNLAYLEDRVLVGRGEPQLYGTQIGCGPDGPEPATPIAEEATVDDRRIAAGLDPLADYIAEIAPFCEDD
jgi:hypothetical protein